MKIKSGLLAFVLFSAFTVNAQLFSSETSKVSFDSKTPMEDIAAQTDKAKAAINIETKKVVIKIKMISFKFAKPLMEEHFNEKYVESEKFPDATFNGSIVENVDLSKNGTYKISVKGVLNIHGVEQPRTLTGTAIVKDGKIDLTTSFDVKLVDHKIEVPKVVVKNIAEVISVQAHFVCIPHVKK